MMTILDALLSVAPTPIRLRSTRAGDHKSTCPQCSHNRKKKADPCLSVTITEEGADTKALWKCHHCGWTGWTGTGRFARIRGAERRIYKRPTIKPVPPQPAVLAWLEGRGIPAWLVRQEQIFAAHVWMPQSRQHENVVAFPFFKDGQIVDVKYREPVNKWFRTEGDAEPVPYGYDSISGAKEIVIVEGEIDRLSVMRCGFAACISVPSGAPEKEVPDDSPKFAWVEPCISHFEAAERVIIAVDADGPGQVLRRELIRRVGHKKCWVVEWPKIGETQVNDANQLLLLAGDEDLQRALREAQPVAIEGEIGVHDLWSEIEALHNGGELEWTSTGFPSIDPIYRVVRGQVTVVTGPPNAGKSTFLDNVLVNMALADQWKFAVFSPENDPARHAVNLLEKAARQPFFEGPWPTRMGLDEVRSYKAWLAQHFHFLKFQRQPGKDGKRRADVDWLIGMIEYQVRRYGIDGAVIDPYNRVGKPAGQGALSETDFVLDLMDALQACAQRCHIHIWIVAHPAKISRGKDGKRPEDLTLQDVSGSANFDNCTDMGFSITRVWKDPATGEDYKPRDTPVKFTCLKARDRFSGQKGGFSTFSFRFSDATYHPIAEADAQPNWRDG